MSRKSSNNKQLAAEAARTFGGDRKVNRYWDDQHVSCVDILKCSNSPTPAVHSYATLGLSDHPILKGGKDIGVRTEIVGASGAVYDEFSNILATAAFCIINSKWLIHPDAIFPDVVGMYRRTSPMRHLLFVPPFLWGGRLQTLRMPEKTVAWLLAVPISEREYAYAVDSGVDVLRKLFVKVQIDIFDLDRQSIV